jgi:putative FmdB family regulatory protein
MPTYEYQCQACGHQLEAFQRMADEPLKECPACNQLKLERLISAAAFHLKGGGWYKDGYGSSSPGRTDNQRIDRLTKAIDDDKKKTAESTSTESASSSSGTATSTESSTGSTTGTT